jgi:hypothetical protein
LAEKEPHIFQILAFNNSYRWLSQKAEVGEIGLLLVFTQAHHLHVISVRQSKQLMMKLRVDI